MQTKRNQAKCRNPQNSSSLQALLIYDTIPNKVFLQQAVKHFIAVSQSALSFKFNAWQLWCT